MSLRTPLNEPQAEAGASFAEDAGWLVAAHFGDPAAEYRAARQGAALFDLSSRGKVEVRGKEAGFLLNNLATNDVRNLAAGTGCEMFFTNHKARIIAQARAFCVEKSAEEQLYRLDADPGAAERILKHLDRHQISEQVELADRTADHAQLQVAGPRAFDVLTRVFADAVPDLGHLNQPWRIVRAGT